MTPRIITQSEACEPIPDFISVLRAIRDEYYPQMTIWHTECTAMYNECVNTIKPDIDNKWQEITAVYNAMLVISAEATTLQFDEPATASYDPGTGLMSFGIPQGEPGFGLQWTGQDTIENILLIPPTTQGETWQSTNAGVMEDGTTPVIIGDVIIATGTEWDNGGQMRGPKGDSGVQGVPGRDGEVWFVDVLDPSSAQGLDGDMALNTVTYDIFEKRTGAWVAIGNIKGDTGSVGPTAGVWDIARTYIIGEIVSEGEFTYVALAESIGLLPTENPTMWNRTTNIVNNTLTGTSTTESLSAAQGTILNEIKVSRTTYATQTEGGTVKMRVEDGVLYIRNDGINA